MATYRELLLMQEQPLEAHEIATLEDWLRVLEEDVSMFGAAPEDQARMASIADRIGRERGQDAQTRP